MANVGEDGVIALGGGIFIPPTKDFATGATLTVSNNEATGALTSDADGAGIHTQQGALAVNDSVVTDNRVIATAPNGRFAEGAGIMVDTTFSAGPCTPCTLSFKTQS
jgi:hypothetical protein